MSSTLNILKKGKEGAKAAPAEPEAEAPAEEAAAKPKPKLNVVKKTAPAAEAPAEEPAAEEPAAETATEAKPKPAAAKAKASTKTKVDDLLVQIASEVENMDEDTVKTAINTVLDEAGQDEFKLGGYLARVQTQQWFGEHETFRAWVVAEAGIEYRKAMYLISIYNSLLAAEVPWAKVGHLGWTKLKDLAAILTKDNVDAVVKAVADMNAASVKAYADAFNASGEKGEGASAPEDTPNIKSKTFKLFDGQRETVDLAIEKAKKDGKTDSDGAALEYIAMDFLNATKKAPAKAAPEPAAEATFELDMSEEGVKAILQAIRDNSDSLEDAINLILGGVQEIFPEADIAVELNVEEAAEA